jgi:hypothetical protein
VTRARAIYLLVFVVYLLHNDLWLWEDPRLLAGLPAGLLYHIGFCFVASAILYLLVHHAWPTSLDADADADA